MVLTVTLNPAIDKILILKEFELHKLHRLVEGEFSMVTPGGKGVNIAHTLKLLGNKVLATGFAGGHAGHMLCDSLRQMGITTGFVFTDGATRTNTSILDTKNETLTELNDFGQKIVEADIQFFLDNYSRLIDRAKLIVIAGSLPKGVPDEVYNKMIKLAHEHNKKVVYHVAPNHIDALEHNDPFLINPDMRSNHNLLGKHVDGIDKFISVGKDLLVKHKDTEIIIFTHRIENVVAITRDKSYIVRPNNLNIVNMLGYGDAYLSGFIHAFLQEKDFCEVLLYASAAGLTDVEDLYKEIKDIEMIDKNMKRISIEEID